MFRREAIKSVGGYDERLRRIMEDSDICGRMWQAGWETHYVAGSFCTSVQEDRLGLLARKLLRENNLGWTGERPFLRLFLAQSKWLLVRLTRNLAKGRLLFIPIDVAVWARALWIGWSEKVSPARSKCMRR